MAELGTRRRRLFVEDARRNGMYLRTTWHSDEKQFVISTWNEEVCTGAIRVPAADAAQLISLLADGLADAASPATLAAVQPTAGRTLLERIRAYFRRLRHAEPDAPPTVLPLGDRKSA